MGVMLGTSVAIGFRSAFVKLHVVCGFGEELQAGWIWGLTA
jgi:hypothetical protein